MSDELAETAGGCCGCLVMCLVIGGAIGFVRSCREDRSSERQQQELAEQRLLADQEEATFANDVVPELQRTIDDVQSAIDRDTTTLTELEAMLEARDRSAYSDPVHQRIRERRTQLHDVLARLKNKRFELYRDYFVAYREGDELAGMSNDIENALSAANAVQDVLGRIAEDNDAVLHLDDLELD